MMTDEEIDLLNEVKAYFERHGEPGANASAFIWRLWYRYQEIV